MGFDFELAISLLPDLVRGAFVTVSLFIPVVIIGGLLAIGIGVARLSKTRSVALLAEVFTVVFRGAPLLLVLYLIYNGLPQVPFVRETFLWQFFREAYWCAVVGLTLNHAAFLSEIWRSAFRSIPAGYTEAASALGMRGWPVFWKIRLPLAFRYGYSSIRNEVVMFLKATAVVGAITVFDILAFANDAVQLTFDAFTPFVMAGLVYWTMIQFMQAAFGYWEQHLYRYAKR